jgi:hypothetical protein
MPSFRSLRILPVFAVLFALLPAHGRLLYAQSQGEVAEPGHVAFVDGTATLERDGQTDAVNVNEPVVAGDRIQTTSGRLELLFSDGSALDLDEYSTAEILSPTLVRLSEGRIILVVNGANDPAAAVRYQIDTPVASARTEGPGEYRVAVLGAGDVGQTEVAVIRGAVTMGTERSSIALYAGQRSVVAGDGAPSPPQPFNSARLDAFDRWSAMRRQARTYAATAQYLPGDLRMYSSTLDRYGTWQYSEPYGYVWYPTVAPDWRPYYYGYWSPVRTYGWTWVGLDVWSWPTHHFGRWGFLRGSWFWIPGRTWGPAWVSWAAAPGYVSWCPLGFDGRPTFALSFSIGDPWVGWVVVPRTSFGFRGYYVNRHAIAPRHQFSRSTPFVAQATAPVPVPRRVAARSNIVDVPVSSGAAGRRVVPPVLSTNSDRAAQLRDSGRPDGRRPAAAGRPYPAPGSNLSATTAVRRQGAPPVAGSAAGREFKQPLPDTFGRSPAAGVRRAAPAAPSAGSNIRPAVPRRTDPGTPRYRTAPLPDRPGAAPVAPQAVPRWNAPARQVPGRTDPPPVVAAPSARSPQVMPAPYQGAVRRAGPQAASPGVSAPPPPAPSYGGGAGRHVQQPSGPPPAGAPASRAVPRSEGSANQGGGRRR